MAQLDEKYLKGLTFTGANSKEVEVDGKTKRKWIPFERPMKAEDVLSFADRGDVMVIVGKDGRKHKVSKK